MRNQAIYPVVEPAGDCRGSDHLRLGSPGSRHGPIRISGRHHRLRLREENPVYSLGLSANKKNEGNFTATKSGSMPLNVTASEPYCENAKPGPYDFTASVKHAVRLSVPRVPILRSKGTLRVGVHNPEGGPINAPALGIVVELKLGGVWRSIGTGTVTNGIATVEFKVPRSLRNRSTTMQVVASGAEYVTETSSAQG